MLRPSCHYDIGIRNTTKTAVSVFQTSFKASVVLKKSILSNSPFDINILEHTENSKTVAKSWKEQVEQRNLEGVENLIQSLPVEKKLQSISSKEQLPTNVRHGCLLIRGKMSFSC